MTQTTNVALLERCAQYVQELAEIYQFGGTRCSHLLADLDRLEHLIRVSADNRSKPTIGGDLARASVERATTNSRTWLEDIVDAFQFLGGEACYQDLYRTIYARANRRFPPKWKAVVRQTIELHSQDSANFRGCHVFDHVEHGRWRLAKRSRS